MTSLRLRQFGLLAAVLGLAAPSPARAGELSVTGTAKFSGDRGLLVRLTDGLPAYLEDDSPTAETRYRARFYARLDQLTMNEGDRFELLVGYDDADAPQFRLVIARLGGQNKLALAARLDSGGFAETTPGQEATIAPGWRAVEIDWRAGAGDGALSLWIDGAAAQGLTALANDQSRVDRARWGAVDGLDPGSAGALELDAFESARFDPVGRLCFTAAQFGQALSAWPSGHSVRYLLTAIIHACPP